MDISEFEKDNRKSCMIENDIPDVVKEEPCCLGIDEAGRGPVLGPMVYGTCFAPLSFDKQLKELGFADSKTLSEEKREELMVKIQESSKDIGWIVHILSPNYISNCMLRRYKYNLNELSHDTAIGLIKRALEKGANLKEVYVDTVGPPETYQAKLKNIFPELDITVAKKADATYPIVSAASICAKVARDHAVKGWKFLEDVDVEDGKFGSGYPSDPNTKKFMSGSLDPVFGFPNLVRFSWSTASVILEEKAVPVKWEDDDDEEENEKSRKRKNNPSVSSYFAASSENLSKKRHSFFTDRCLKQVTTF